MNPLLQQGLLLHQRGQLAQAEPLYQEVLRAEPNNPAAYFLLGVLALQQGRTHPR